MHRRFLGGSALAVVVTASLLTGSGAGASAAAARGGQLKIPVGLAAAIHARLGAGAIRSRWAAAASATQGPLIGFSIALSADGTTALVGAPGVANGQGTAYVFHASSAGSWSSSGVPTATLTYKGKAPRLLFGIAVALSADGTTAFVDAPFVGGGSFAAGKIYAFHASAEDAWASSSKPTAALTVAQSPFLGITLALSTDGTTLVAGAPFSNAIEGGADVFHVSSEDAWASTSTPTATLSNAAESQDDGLVGEAVAISGDGTTALLSDSANPSGGGAYLYHVSSEDSWTTSSTPTAILSDAGSGQTDALGNAVALSSDGTVALLGAPGANSSTGAADVFHASAADAWATTSTPSATLTNAGGSENDGFGGWLAVSTDGTTTLVSASGLNSRRGAAYIFHASGEGAWSSSSTPTATLSNSGAHARDNLGFAPSLSADGATALLGAPGVDVQTGAAYVFYAADESSWASSSTPNATLTDKKLAACVVPRLKGLKLRPARLALAAGRCQLGKVTKVHARHKKGRVVSQNHRPGARLAINAKVAVKVGK